MGEAETTHDEGNFGMKMPMGNSNVVESAERQECMELNESKQERNQCAYSGNNQKTVTGLTHKSCRIQNTLDDPGNKSGTVQISEFSWHGDKRAYYGVCLNHHVC